ncbi:MAG TPA: hypothetical protein VGN05_05890 [Parvibaculum sp.]|jgi:hypothetical protein
MDYRRSIAGILSLLAAASAAAFSGPAYADEAIEQGATLIDITGEVTTAGLSGGVGDPVPIFVGSSGPVIFVMGTPSPAESAIDRAQQTRIHANPELNRR